MLQIVKIISKSFKNIRIFFNKPKLYFVKNNNEGIIDIIKTNGSLFKILKCFTREFFNIIIKVISIEKQKLLSLILVKKLDSQNI